MFLWLLLVVVGGVLLLQRFYCGLYCDPDLALKDIKVVPSGGEANREFGNRPCNPAANDIVTPNAALMYPLSPVVSGLGVCDSLCVTVRHGPIA
eukprot:1189275-Prorocentrum_minimum.AAC.2